MNGISYIHTRIYIEWGSCCHLARLFFQQANIQGNPPDSDQNIEGALRLASLETRSASSEVLDTEPLKTLSLTDVNSSSYFIGISLTSASLPATFQLHSLCTLSLHSVIFFLVLSFYPTRRAPPHPATPLRLSFHVNFSPLRQASRGNIEARSGSFCLSSTC